ncbi:hypothetical protein HYS03_02860 [Candidatus Woesebacteria bacterium]|nr:hypothetical protein [Candidatus Woesebacteria bacterium]
MSKLFFDQLVNLEKIQKEIDSIATSREEKEELWQLVDELVHHRVIGCILDNLPHEHHHDFLTQFHARPYDERILDYLEEKIDGNTRELIIKEVDNLALEILEDINKDH